LNLNNICGVPFREITLYYDFEGRDLISAYPCCSAWLKEPYRIFCLPVEEDKDHKVDLMSTWNSDKLKDFRKSILNGTYEFCKIGSCPFIFTRNLPEVPEIAIPYIEKGITHLDYPPLITRTNIDRACNLQCPSCRSYKIPFPNKNSYPRLVSILSSGTKKIFINGAGELFINRYLMKALQEFSKDKYPDIDGFEIITNGTSFNRTAWLSLPKDLKDIILDVCISVDSVVKETYNKIRIGGSFENLNKNLKFLSELRKEGSLKSLSYSCVLQKDNIKELPEFIKFAIEKNVDNLFINKIENWGHISSKYFKEYMALPDDYLIVYKEIFEESIGLIKNSNVSLTSNLFKTD